MLALAVGVGLIGDGSAMAAPGCQTGQESVQVPFRTADGEVLVRWKCVVSGSGGGESESGGAASKPVRRLTLEERQTRDRLAYERLTLCLGDAMINGVPDPEAQRKCRGVSVQETVDDHLTELVAELRLPTPEVKIGPDPSVNKVEHGGGGLSTVDLVGYGQHGVHLSRLPGRNPDAHGRARGACL